MSLFIGNISRNADYRDIEKAFQSFGRCKFNPRGKYGFIEFDKEVDAEDAKGFPLRQKLWRITNKHRME